MKYVHVRFQFEPLSEIAGDLLSAELGEIGFESFVSDNECLDAYVPKKDFSTERIDNLIKDFMLDVSITYTFEDVDDVNWNEEWEKHYFQPIVIDDKCCIRSTFHKVDKTYDYEILIDPKMAFGTGHHQTTSLMIKTMLSLDLKDKSVLDMGCGTAVLAILASMKGAADITAIDIESWAYDNALENAKLNHTDNIKVLHGDIDLLTNEMFDVILANINRNVLLDHIPHYAKHLNNTGLLLMSGFYEADIPVIRAKAEECGLSFADHKELDHWVAVTFCNDQK
ncbi:MAG: 50S ribosomal protein L11 methyltransferase [Fermentimonas sp.]|jgi:ribosomal protein L11 methyltransferase